MEPHPEFPNIHSEYGVWRPLAVLPFFANDTITVQHDYLLFGDCGAMGTSRPTGEGRMGKKTSYRWIAVRWGKKRPTVGLRRDGEKSAPLLGHRFATRASPSGDTTAEGLFFPNPPVSHI